jgi:hypothetical protein
MVFIRKEGNFNKEKNKVERQRVTDAETTQNPKIINKSNKNVLKDKLEEDIR